MANKIVNAGMICKQKIQQYFINVLLQKLQYQQQVLADLKETGTNETKSTAGDKHETALAMLQIEQANMRKQMEQTHTQIAILQKLTATNTSNTVLNGSVVKTNTIYFYISAGIGKATIDGQLVIAISPTSPLGIKLMGTTVGTQIIMQQQTYTIQAIS
jgi:hypothetical protein